MNDQDISDEFLNSFVDNQLDSAEKTQAFDSISRNDALKNRVCELRGLKVVIQHAYSLPPLLDRTTLSQIRPRTKQFQALAACLLLLIGGISGWMTHSWTGSQNRHEMTAIIQSAPNSDAIADTRKIIVHVSTSNPMKLKTALDETEGLLENYRRANHQIQVELIANKRGVDLLRSDVSAYKGRILMMQDKYPNLNFLVCGKTIGKLKNNGESVQLLPHTGVASSAADQINKRLHEGWGYVRI
jgi:intracellular sulfur oxidation DsrE/DsrF family protein